MPMREATKQEFLDAVNRRSREVRRIVSRRSQTVIHTDCGRPVAEETITYTRGKVTGRTYTVEVQDDQ